MLNASPLAVSMLKASGSGVNVTRSSPSLTVCGRAAPRSFAAGAPNVVCSQRAVVGDVDQRSILDGLHGEAEGVRADGGELDLDVFARDL